MDCRACVNRASIEDKVFDAVATGAVHTNDKECCKIKETQFSAVLNWDQALWNMNKKLGDYHLPSCNHCNKPCQEPHSDEEPTDEFNNASSPVQTD